MCHFGYCTYMNNVAEPGVGGAVALQHNGAHRCKAWAWVLDSELYYITSATCCSGGWEVGACAC